jgi:hypothetical protein
MRNGTQKSNKPPPRAGQLLSHRNSHCYLRNIYEQKMMFRSRRRSRNHLYLYILGIALTESIERLEYRTID